MRLSGRLILGGTAAIIVLVATMTPVHALSPEMVLRRLISAVNRGDMEAVSELLTDDVTFTDCAPECMTAAGKSAVLHELSGTIAAKTRIRVHDVDANEGREEGVFEVTYSLEIENDATRAAGIDRIVADCVATVEGKKFSSDITRFDLGDEQTRQFFAAQAEGAAPSRLPTTGDGSLAEPGSSAGPAGAGTLAVALALGGAAVPRLIRRSRPTK